MLRETVAMNVNIADIECRDEGNRATNSELFVVTSRCYHNRPLYPFDSVLQKRAVNCFAKIDVFFFSIK